MHSNPNFMCNSIIKPCIFYILYKNNLYKSSAEPEETVISPNIHEIRQGLLRAITLPLPIKKLRGFSLRMERAKGFEPSTPTLARLYSTPELRPLKKRFSLPFLPTSFTHCNSFFNFF